MSRDLDKYLLDHTDTSFLDLRDKAYKWSGELTSEASKSHSHAQYADSSTTKTQGATALPGPASDIALLTQIIQKQQEQQDKITRQQQEIYQTMQAMLQGTLQPAPVVPAAAPATVSSPSTDTAAGQPHKNRTFQCYYCNKEGHKANNCRKKGRSSKIKPKR